MQRLLSKGALAAIALNGLIGAGIFALPSVAANQLAFFAPWMFLLCAGLMLPIVASFALLAKQFDQTGGPVLYASQAFSPFVGFQTGWLLYVGRMTALAANGHAIVLYLSLFIPSLAEPVIAGPAVCLIIGLLATLNIIGVKNAMNSMLLITGLKLLPIFLLVAFGITYIQIPEIVAARAPILSEWPGAFLLLIYAFIGFEGALIPAGEAQQPKRDLPQALLLTLLFSAVLYFLIQAIVVSVLPMPIDGKTPLADTAQTIASDLGTFGGTEVMLVAAAISIFGNLLALMLAAPRMTYAMAEQGQMPKWFSQLNSKYLTPVNSILFLSAAAMLLALTGGFVWLAIFSSLARLIGYLICIFALPKLHLQEKVSNSFLVWTCAITASMACLWLIAQANVRSWLFLVVFILFGSLFYGYTKHQAK
jgi:amino acid transporter